MTSSKGRTTRLPAIWRNARASGARRGTPTPDLTLSSLSHPGGERAEWQGQSKRLKGVFANFADPARGSFYSSDGTYSTKVPEELVIAELEQVGCYPSTFLHNNPEGKFRMVGDRGLGYSIASFEAEAAGLVISRGAPGSADEAEWLRSYLDQRQTLLTFSFSNWGLPGLERMRAAFAGPGHDAVLERMEARLDDPKFASALKPLDRAMMKALVVRPEDFLPCGALRHMAPA